jgi:hypothetical protein
MKHRFTNKLLEAKQITDGKKNKSGNEVSELKSENLQFNA